VNKYKRCTLCLKLKRIDDFHKDASKVDQHSARCASCRNILNNAYRIDKASNTWESKRRPKLTTEQKRQIKNYNAKRHNHYLVFKNATLRAIKFGAFVGKFTKKEIKRFYSDPCFYCGSIYRLSIDHVIPLSEGGSHTLGNLVSCCGPCNASKGNKLITQWKKVRGW
jgi:5-methylcytosine-specific restriction endonuclease McrA